jgi:hypothetical protein
MRISNLPPVGGVQGHTSATRSVSGEAFRLPDEKVAAKNTTSSRGTAPMAAAGLETLLALQALEGDREKRRRSFRRGSGLLDLLDKLKLDFLSGRPDPSVLLRLTQMLGQRETSGDAGLDHVLDEIELRAQVELAKIDVAKRRAA